MRLQIFLDVFGLGHDVAGNETVGNLVVLREGIVKYPSTQFLQQVRLRFFGQGLHVRHVHVAVLVERGGERLVHVIGMGDLVDVVRNGMVEDVGLDRPAVDVTFQRQYLTVARIHAEQVDDFIRQFGNLNDRKNIDLLSMVRNAGFAAWAAASFSYR